MPFFCRLASGTDRNNRARPLVVERYAQYFFFIVGYWPAKKDAYLFLQVYFDRPLREILTRHEVLLDSVTKRAVQLYRRDFKRLPVLPFKQ